MFLPHHLFMYAEFIKHWLETLLSWIFTYLHTAPLNYPTISHLARTNF